MIGVSGSTLDHWRGVEGDTPPVGGGSPGPGIDHVVEVVGGEAAHVTIHLE